MIFFVEKRTPEILGNSRINDNFCGDDFGGHSLADVGNPGALGSDSLICVDAVNSSSTVGAPKRVKRRYLWICQWCQMEFETETYSQRYCKPSHKQKAYELRRDERLKKPVDAEI